MDKLTIEHLAPYAPYRPIVIVGKKVRDLTALCLDSEFVFVSAYKGSREKHMISMCHIMPVLRPMYDFDEYFSKIFDTDIEVKEFLNEGFIDECGFADLEDMLTYESSRYPVGVYVLALKHHFDVFGLIDKGLAVDINTVKI